MPETVCAQCVHRFVMDDGGASPCRCPGCREPLPSVHRETLAHLRETQGRWQRAPLAAAGSRFRATVRTRPGAPWITFTAIKILSTTFVRAVDRGARGHPENVYKQMNIDNSCYILTILLC
jgi:hypothetical protein